MLKLTQKEIYKLINDDLNIDRFDCTFDEIPIYHPDNIKKDGETHRDYINKGSEYRWFIFKDTLTDIDYCLNYTYHQDWPNDIMSLPDNIIVVENDEDSDIYIKPVPIIKKEVPLSPENQADKNLWEEYLTIKDQCKIVMPKEKLNIPKEEFNDLINMMRTKSFSIVQLRSKVIPLCIKYKLEDKSFWNWLQGNFKKWKV